jgi:hypothetical protein
MHRVRTIHQTPFSSRSLSRRPFAEARSRFPAHLVQEPRESGTPSWSSAETRPSTLDAVQPRPEADTRQQLFEDRKNVRCRSPQTYCVPKDNKRGGRTTGLVVANRRAFCVLPKTRPWQSRVMKTRMSTKFARVHVGLVSHVPNVPTSSLESIA